MGLDSQIVKQPVGQISSQDGLADMSPSTESPPRKKRSLTQHRVRRLDGRSDRDTKGKSCAARRTKSIVAGGTSGIGKATEQVRMIPFVLAANPATNSTTRAKVNE
jgi:hypothetical protein